MSVATLSVCSNKSSKDCGSLALEIGMFMKYWFSWKVDDLIMLCKASIVCQWRHWVLCVSFVWCWYDSTTDWLNSYGVRFGLCCFRYVWGDVGVSCGTCKWYASSSGCCVTPKIICLPGCSKVCIIQWVWCSVWCISSRFLWRVNSWGVLSWGLARACEIASYIILLVFSCAIMHTQVIFFRSPNILFVTFHGSCVIMLSCCRMTIYWYWECTSWFWCDHSDSCITNGVLLYWGCLWWLLFCLSIAYINVTLGFIVYALIAGDSACGNGIMWTNLSLHNANM